jgi:hypothetical protein
MVIEFISLLLTMAPLKGMKGALAPFSCLVRYICPELTKMGSLQKFRVLDQEVDKSGSSSQ